MGDEAAGEFEERFVDVGSAFPTDTQTAEAMAPGEGPLDHPPVSTQPVPRLATAGTDLIAVGIVVVAAVGEEGV